MAFIPYAMKLTAPIRENAGVPVRLPS